MKHAFQAGNGKNGIFVKIFSNHKKKQLGAFVP